MLLWGLAFPRITESQEPPYPIIFIHGIGSSSEMWEEAGLVDLFYDEFLWGEFQRLDVCLNADRNNATGRHDTDIEYIFANGPTFLRNYYLINFDVDPGSAWDNPHPFGNKVLSNEAAITKQGKALGQCIKAIIRRTKKDKVILVGHSMGGLAARDYLENPANWPDSSHHVAKLITLGTPHWGSNAVDIQRGLIFDLYSEASRDLRYHYGEGSFPPSSEIDKAVYLFGGDEQEPISQRYFYNYDFNGDGNQGGRILGLNENYKTRLPSDVDYVWLTGNHIVFGRGSDGAVRFDRQALTEDIGITKTFAKQVYHSKKMMLAFQLLSYVTSIPSLPYEFEAGQHAEIIEALDETSDFQKAWTLKVPGIYSSFAISPILGQSLDIDTYRIQLNQPGRLEVIVTDLTPTQNNTSAIARLFDLGSTTKLIASANNTPRQSTMTFAKDGLVAGEYFFQLLVESTSETWKHPHRIELKLVGGSTRISLRANSTAIDGNTGSSTLLFAELRDAEGNLVPTATNPVTFTILSSPASAILIGTNPVTPINGVATISLQATTTPGLVTIQASTAGLNSATTVVSVYTNPTQVSGLIATNTTWTLAKSPYVVTDYITVSSDAILTIEPGVEVRFNRDRGMFINGALIANGAPLNKIVFTANTGNPFPGYWGGIRFNDSGLDKLSVLNHCNFLYGGGNEPAPIVFDPRANPTVSNVKLFNNLKNGINLIADYYNANILLNVFEIPYFVNNRLAIGASYTMTIMPGVILKFDRGLRLDIYGNLLANGIPAQPIIFTSFADDAHGGDTNGDGFTAPTPGIWEGVQLYNTSQASSFNYCRLYYSNYPILVDARVNPRINKTILSNNAYNGIRLFEDAYSSSILLDVVGLPYFLLNGDLTINRGARMTIKPGIILKFAKERDIYVYGALNATGTASQPIIFTSIKDDVNGGDTNGDGNTFPTAGDWGGIVYFYSNIDSLSALSFCKIYHGGGSGYSEGIPLNVDPRNRPAFSNLTISNNTINAINVVNSEFNSNIYLEYVGIPYTILGYELTIAQGATMTIKPGVIVKLGRETDLRVKGTLIANGTSDNPITFTSLKDDTKGGDTNGDGQSRGANGDWGGIVFLDDSDDLMTSLDFCIIAFGGSSYFAAEYPLVFDNASPKIQHTTISNSRSHGVICYNTASPDFGRGNRNSVGQNRFLGFKDATNKFVFYNNGTADISAKFNYWETSDRAIIDRIIFDRNDDGSKGRVLYEPFQPNDPTAVSASEHQFDVPFEFHLGQNYPNPFNPETRFEIQLPHASHVRVEVVNILGQNVTTLLDEKRQGGYHKLMWNGQDDLGKLVPSGVYIVSMKVGDFVQTRKIVWLQ